MSVGTTGAHRGVYRMPHVTINHIETQSAGWTDATPVPNVRYIVTGNSLFPAQRLDD